MTGPTGIGKTWRACALAQKACREGWSARSLRLPRRLAELAVAKGDGRYGNLMTSLAKTDGVMLDDWALAPLGDAHRRAILELLEDRHDRRATVVTSQLPIEHWHEALGEPTLAEAILDRLVHNAYKILLQGDSMRKRMAHPKPVPPRRKALAARGRLRETLRLRGWAALQPAGHPHRLRWARMLSPLRKVVMVHST